jgi:hypothetical protein
MLTSLSIDAGDKSGDIKIFEGQEPVDAVFSFLKARELLEQPDIVYKVLEKLCSREGVVCRRVTPFETIKTLEVTWNGGLYCLDVTRPPAIAEWTCSDKNTGQACSHHILGVAADWCARIAPAWKLCESVILDALHDVWNGWEEERWEGSDHYEHLRLIRQADSSEIESAYEAARTTMDYIEKAARKTKVDKAYDVLGDPVARALYDAPCIPLFGSLCGKKGPDGGLTFTADGDMTLMMDGSGGGKATTPQCRI